MSNNQDKDLKKKQEDRAQTIKGLVATPDEELQKQEDGLWAEKQTFFQEHLVKVSNLRRVVRVLKNDLDKYPNIQKQYDETKEKYDAALKEAQEKEEEINNSIQNIQAARLVKRDAVALNAQKEIDDNAVKAAVEGQKPFTPQITPDQDFELVAMTKAVANDIAQQPGEDKNQNTQQQQKETTTTTKKEDQLLSSSSTNTSNASQNIKKSEGN